jgi:hypothetical protein
VADPTDVIAVMTGTPSEPVTRVDMTVVALALAGLIELDSTPAAIALMEALSDPYDVLDVAAPLAMVVELVTGAD